MTSTSSRNHLGLLYMCLTTDMFHVQVVTSTSQLYYLVREHGLESIVYLFNVVNVEIENLFFLCVLHFGLS